MLAAPLAVATLGLASVRRRPRAPTTVTTTSPRSAPTPPTPDGPSSSDAGDRSRPPPTPRRRCSTTPSACATTASTCPTRSSAPTAPAGGSPSSRSRADRTSPARSRGTPSSTRPSRRAEPLMEAALADVEIDPERQAEMREQMLDVRRVHARARHRHARPGVRRQRDGSRCRSPAPASSRLDERRVRRPPTPPAGRRRSGWRVGRPRRSPRADVARDRRRVATLGVVVLAARRRAPAASPTASAGRPRRAVARRPGRRRGAEHGGHRTPATSCATRSSTEPSATARRHRSCSPAAAR